MPRPSIIFFSCCSSVWPTTRTDETLQNVQSHNGITASRNLISGCDGQHYSNALLGQRENRDRHRSGLRYTVPSLFIIITHLTTESMRFAIDVRGNSRDKSVLHAPPLDPKLQRPPRRPLSPSRSRRPSLLLLPSVLLFHRSCCLPQDRRHRLDTARKDIRDCSERVW